MRFWCGNRESGSTRYLPGERRSPKPAHLGDSHDLAALEHHIPSSDPHHRSFLPFRRRPPASSGPVTQEQRCAPASHHVSESLDVNEAAIETFCRAYRAAGGFIDPSLGFDAALFHALRYMWFDNTEARWERIDFALRRESDLTDLMS